MNIALVGFGFIGRNLIKAMNKKIGLLKRIDGNFKVTGVFDSRGGVLSNEGLDLQKLSCVNRASKYGDEYIGGTSFIDVLEEERIDMLIEATPTNIETGDPGLTYIKNSLERGIHVVTANKGPLVLAFRELTDLAEKHECSLRYEATVAAALPVFSLYREGLQGDEVKRISGILNGTTNYILSKMFFEETSFELALKDAQERGFAEANPSYDVDGVDAACKVVILGNSIMGKNLRLSDVKTVGIRRVTPEAVDLAKRSGYAIKLLGVVDDEPEVSPKLVPTRHPLCVHGNLNAVRFETDLSREITIVGYGSGRETVSAILNDVISILKAKKD